MYTFVHNYKLFNYTTVIKASNYLHNKRIKNGDRIMYNNKDFIRINDNVISIYDIHHELLFKIDISKNIVEDYSKCKFKSYNRFSTISYNYDNKREEVYKIGNALLLYRNGVNIFGYELVRSQFAEEYTIDYIVKKIIDKLIPSNYKNK